MMRSIGGSDPRRIGRGDAVLQPSRIPKGVAGLAPCPRHFEEEPDVELDRTDAVGAIRAAVERCSNWGRWGADDVLGTANLIDDAKRREGAALVRHGRTLWLFIGEMWDLDALAADCAADGVYDFWLTAAPLPVTCAVGAPVNPIAVK
jgi:hypothetical protein